MAWLAGIRHWLNRPRPEAQAAACYRAIVRQARQPGFYLDTGVPDTPQGRFELVMLHAALVMERLEAWPAFNQNLFDLMFADFDVNLRELGVGDLGVGKRVHSWAQAFHGRALAYSAALSRQDELAVVLKRNIGIADDGASALAAYMQAAAASLQRQDDNILTMQGQIDWPEAGTHDDRHETAA